MTPLWGREVTMQRVLPDNFFETYKHKFPLWDKIDKQMKKDLSKVQAGDFVKDHRGKYGVVIQTPKGLIEIYEDSRYGNLDNTSEYRRLQTSFNYVYCIEEWESSWHKGEPVFTGVTPEVGKWQHVTTVQGYNYIWYVKERIDTEIYGYGWNVDHGDQRWFFEQVLCELDEIDSIKEVDPTPYFAKEFKKRGIVKGATVKDMSYSNDIAILKSDHTLGGVWDSPTQRWVEGSDGVNMLVFKEGKWAEPIKDTIELTCKVNGKEIPLSTISEETLKSLRNS